MQTKEQRIRKITQLYYSNPEVQKAIFEFSKNREVVPSYMMEHFGKRPDSLQYKGDIFELVKRGATSFHCSEEIWENVLEISTDMNPEQLNELREGWDLLLDIDSKYLDYSKVLAQLIIKFLKFHGVKNVGIKFSGSKGFHLIVPWKTFPEEVYNVKTKDMFPEWPRILTQYIIEMTKKDLVEKITDMTKRGSKYIKDFQAPKEVMPDLILVSPRHLFRMPYSLHEKTALASVVLTEEELENFQPIHARFPLKAKVRNFLPNSNPGEASELLREALDWHKNLPVAEKSYKKKDFKDYKPINLKEVLAEGQQLSEKFFPPSIQKILLGVSDGRKRALFILLGFFRTIGLDIDELEKRIYSWNSKNKILLKEGYIKTQLSWSYRNKIVPPPNFDKDYYKGIGIVPTDEELRYKNPSNYTIRKIMQENSNEAQNKKKPKRKSAKSQKTKDNFKNKVSLFSL